MTAIRAESLTAFRTTEPLTQCRVGRGAALAIIEWLDQNRPTDMGTILSVISIAYFKDWALQILRTNAARDCLEGCAAPT